MIRILSEDECRELLSAASVGRVGFIDGGRVQIIPVNYVLDGHDVIIRTVNDGVLAALPSSTVDVAFEVDHLDALSGEGWSVLLSGIVRVISDPDEIAAIKTHRVSPWAGPDRPLHLRFTAAAISGRRVRRERNE